MVSRNDLLRKTVNPARSVIFDPSVFFLGIVQRSITSPSFTKNFKSSTALGAKLPGAMGRDFLPHPKIPMDKKTTKRTKKILSWVEGLFAIEIASLPPSFQGLNP